MRTITIKEQTTNQYTMANLLREIADYLEDGDTGGSYPQWELYGSNEIEKVYVPAEPIPFPEMPEGYTDEMLVEQIKAIIAEDGKLQAVKFVKNLLNLGLKEAKDYCDNL